MLKKKKIILLVVILVFVGILWGQNIHERALGRSVGDGQRKFSAENFRGESVNVLPDTASLEINGVRYQNKITETISVYDFMASLREDGKINFKDKAYVGMGKFIEEINGVKGNGDKYWIYYVNGKKAKIGVSDYKINPGDVVSWKYEKEIN